MAFLAKGVLALCLAGSVISPFRAAEGADRVTHRGIVYRVFLARANDVSLMWRDPQGRRFGQLSQVQTFLEGQGRRVRFLMNAGIFEPNWTPSGLLIIDGQVLCPLNQRSGVGNFFLLPNGIFLVTDNGAFVRTTLELAHWEGPLPRLAIQSGPLLLRAGIMHSAFRQESTSRLHRNGVGVMREGTVLFAITEFDQTKRPNLWEFADFFRSQGCDDAMFLDGDISQAAFDPKGPLTPGNYFAAIFAVSEPLKTGP